MKDLLGEEERASRGKEKTTVQKIKADLVNSKVQQVEKVRWRCRSPYRWKVAPQSSSRSDEIAKPTCT